MNADIIPENVIDMAKTLPLSVDLASNKIRRLLVAYSITEAMARAAGRILLETDLDRNIPAHLRREALDIAVERGLLVKTKHLGMRSYRLP